MAAPLRLPRATRVEIIRQYVLGTSHKEISATFNVSAGYTLNLIAFSDFHDTTSDASFQALDRLGRLTYLILRKDGVNHQRATSCARQEMAWRQQRKIDNEAARRR